MIRRGDGEVEREYGDGVGEVRDEDDVGARGEGRRTLQRTSTSIVFMTENLDISESQSLFPWNLASNLKVLRTLYYGRIRNRIKDCYLLGVIYIFSG